MSEKGYQSLFEDVTVVTLTRGRPELLSRAIASVRSQDYLGRIDHLVIIDDCPITAEYLAGTDGTRRRRLIPHFETRVGSDIGDVPSLASVYPRIARLLNIGIELARSRWVAFLDDDNEYDSNHLSSLVACALRNNCLATHSSRKIYYANGLPFLARRFPWTHNLTESVRIYELLCSMGVWLRGSNVLHDRAGPAGLTAFRNSTLMSSRDPVFMVDTSVWLLDRELLLKYPVPDEYSGKDLKECTAPDDKLLELLLRNGVRIISTGLPTLRYYLGGISN